MTKVSQRLLKEALIRNGAIYARAAKWLLDAHGIEITRAAIKVRADKIPEFIAEIQETNVDWSESTLADLIRSNTIDPRVKLQAVKFHLSTKGQNRGYKPGMDIDVKGDINITGVRIVADQGEPDTNEQ